MKTSIRNAGVFKLFPGDPHFSTKILRDPEERKKERKRGSLSSFTEFSEVWGYFGHLRQVRTFMTFVQQPAIKDTEKVINCVHANAAHYGRNILQSKTYS